MIQSLYAGIVNAPRACACGDWNSLHHAGHRYDWSWHDPCCSGQYCAASIKQAMHFKDANSAADAHGKVRVSDLILDEDPSIARKLTAALLLSLPVWPIGLRDVAAVETKFDLSAGQPYG